MNPQSPSVPEVEAIEASRRVDDGALLLDVRNPDEWEAGHAEGAVWIPLRELEARHGELPTDRSIMVICRSGARSARAAEALNVWGHDATNVAGGSLAWTGAGLPFVADDGRPPTVA